MRTSSLIEIQKHISGITYPAKKQSIIKQVNDKGAPEEIISTLNGIPDREYMNAADVSSELEMEEDDE